jgi:hypothetical protein
MSVRIIVLGFVLGPTAILGAIGLAAYWRRHWGFRAEYRRLVETTPTARPARALRPTRPARPAADPASAFALRPVASGGDEPVLFPEGAEDDSWDCTGFQAPATLAAADRDYYATCWTHIIGTFAESPATALDLATHLTANLLLHRGLADADSERPGDLPADWRFPTAEGYREAQRITQDARVVELPAHEMSKALMLYRALFEEVLAAPTATDAQL